MNSIPQHIDEDDEDFEAYALDVNFEPEESYCCSNGCMDCLGLSWRDFF